MSEHLLTFFRQELLADLAPEYLLVISVYKGWMFSNYIALHWYYKIYQMLAKTGLISQYSAMDILDFLQEIRKIKIDGKWYLKEATAKTGKVLKKLGLNF